MKFIVRRTSHSYRHPEAPPCQHAYEGECRWITRYTFKDFGEYRQKYGKPFTATGSDHRTYPGGISRYDEPQPCWMIDIADLDALNAFTDQHGEVVIGGNEYDQPSIEIYDDYRE